MLTATPLDLTPFGTVLQGIGLLYWLAVLAALAFVLWKVKGWLWKSLLGMAVLAIMVGPVAVHVMRRNSAEQQAKAKLDEAMARFETHCKSAGEKISRIVENVDGVVWMKWRDTKTNDHDQFKLDDPYGHDCGGEACIADLLRVSKGAELNSEVAKLHTRGYRFIDTMDTTGQLYRYIGVVKLRPIWTDEAIARQKARTGKGVEPGDHEFTVERQPIEKPTARYGITWDDSSTREDREHWIAGGSLKVIDLQTNELIAERVGYMMDRGLGSTAGFRSPWGDAPRTACPSFVKAPGGGPFMGYRTRDFVLRVLQSKQGE